MKNIILILLFGVSAHAEVVRVPMLQLLNANGSVAPEHRKTEVCNIFDDEVVRIITAMSSGQPDILKSQVAYTRKIKNAAAVVELIKKAAKGKVTRNLGPIGGASDIYKAYLKLKPNKPAQLVQLHAVGGVEIRNASLAAKTLVDFINYNCKQQ